MNNDITINDDLRPEHREQLRAMLASTPAFAPKDVAVALELIDAALSDAQQTDYRFLLAFDGPRLAGYICYGPTPMTQGTYDLYWLATHPEIQRRGVARKLVAAMEERLRAAEARLVRVETSTLEGYGAARQFYLAADYTDTAHLEDFYRPGDDLIIFTKRLDGRRDSGRPSRWDFESLYDMAFSYRDFAQERDFLLECGRRYGTRTPGRVLEWACGPSRHLEHFAELDGIEAVGVDLSPAMIELARQRLGHLPRVSFIAGDMRQQVVTPAVDLAFTMLSSIHVLGSESDVVAHLQSCARSLQPGGVYVIEATHPRDLTAEGANETRWQHQQADATVEGHFRLEIDRRDGPQVPAVLALTYRLGDERREYRTEMRWLVLDLAAWQRVIAQVPELELVARLGDLDLASRFEQPTAWRLVLVLRRRDQ